jgi:hypothetical protein
MSLAISTKPSTMINISGSVAFNHIYNIFNSDHNSLYINNEQIYDNHDKTLTFKELFNGNEIKQKIQASITEFLKNIDSMAKLMDPRLRYLTMKIDTNKELIEINYYPYGENGLDGLYNGNIDVITKDVKSEDPFYIVKTFTK